MSKTRYQHYPHRESIDEFVDRIAADGPLLLVLFGSVATGDFTESSDADILVVFKHPCPWIAVYAHSDGIVQPLVMTLLELRKRIQGGDSLVHEILQDGVLLQGEELLWKDLLGEASRVGRELGMTRHAHGWSYLR